MVRLFSCGRMIQPCQGGSSSRDGFIMAVELHQVNDAARVLAFYDVIPKWSCTPAFSHFSDVVTAFEVSMVRIWHCLSLHWLGTAHGCNRNE